jgi:hypothetical protein
VVFFAASPQVVRVLAELTRVCGRGLGEARGLSVIEATSVADLNALADEILEQRADFFQV